MFYFPYADVGGNQDSVENMAKGTDFEIKTCEFLKALFEELGFHVIEARREKSGTQNGFDILIKFFDEYDRERNFHFECKDYETPLNWDKISIKILELSAMSYKVDGFFWRFWNTL